MPPARLAVVVALFLPAAAGCSSSGAGPELTATTLPAATSVPASSGEVTAGARTFTFDAVCHDVGAGDVIVIGEGVEESGAGFDVLVQAFFGEPYVGVVLADGTRIEPALDAPLDLVFDGRTVRGTGIRFVAGLSSDGTAASTVGDGAVEVECSGFVRGLPAGYDDEVVGAASGS